MYYDLYAVIAMVMYAINYYSIDGSLQNGEDKERRIQEVGGKIASFWFTGIR